MKKNSSDAAPILAALRAVAMTALVAGCGGGGSSTAPPSGRATYLLGGTVIGLRDGATLTFANGNDSVAVSANGSFNFPRRLEPGTSYKVSLADLPGYDCRLSNEAATVASADVTTITVQCMPYVLAGKETVLHRPAGLAVDAEGNAYVADYNYHIIQKITPAGAVSIFAGTKQGGPGGNDGPGSAARFQFNTETAMVFDHEGNLIVTDTCNLSIRKVSKTGVVSTVAGHSSPNCQSNGRNIDGTGSAASFDSVRSIALDVNGDYLVAGSQNAIRRVTPAGVVSTIQWTSPALVGSSDSLNSAVKLTVGKDGTIYAVGSGSRIWKINGSIATSFVGGGATSTNAIDGAGATASFRGIRGLTSDKLGNLYVTEADTVRKISADGTVSTLAGKYGAPGSAFIPQPPPDVIDGAGQAARLQSISAIAADPMGNIIALEENWHILREITPQGLVTTHPGTPLVQQYRDGAGSSSRFSGYALNYAPTVDAKGNLFIRDFGTIRMITPDGTVSRFAGTLGLRDAVDGPTDSATFSSRGVMTADNAGNLYLVGEGGLELRKIGSGTVSTLFQRPEFANASAVAVSAAGNFAISSKDTVRVYSHDGTVLDTIDTARITASFGPGTPAKNASLTFARLVYDSIGNLYIGNSSESVIHKLSKEGVLSTFAGTRGVSGNADGGPGTGTLTTNGELTVDARGNLYTLAGVSAKDVALRKITPSGVISTLPIPWENRPISGVAYGNGRLYAMSQNALMQMAIP